MPRTTRRPGTARTARRAAVLAAAIGIVPGGVAPVGAQPAASPAAAEPRVTLVLQGATPAEALGRLTGASGISLLADAGLLAAAAARGRRVTCAADAAPAERVLRCIVREAGLDFYRLSSGTYVVIGRAEAPARPGALAGLLVDGVTGAPIAHARLTLAERGETRGATESGVAAFAGLAPGRYRVLATALGYAPLAAEVEVAPDGVVRERLALRPQPLAAEPVVVNGIAPDPPVARAGGGPGEAQVDVDALGRAAGAGALAGPSLLGQAAPGLVGVAQRAAFGDRHIQGGEAGEHQLRVDGVPVFDPVLLGRLQGAMSPLAVDQLTVRKAGFGAAAGSYTAGVIDLRQTLGASTGAAGATQLDATSVNARVTAPLRVGGVPVATMLAGRTSLWGIWRPPGVAPALRRWNAVDPVLAQRLAGAPAAGATPGATAVAFADLHAAARAEIGAFRAVSASAYAGRSAVGTPLGGALGVLFGGPVGTAPAGSSAATPAAAAMGDAYAWRTLAAQARYEGLAGGRVAHAVRARLSRHALTHEYAMGQPAPGVGHPRDGNRVTELAVEATADAALGARWRVGAGAELARTTTRVEMVNPLMADVRAALAVGRAAGYATVERRLGGGVRAEAGVRATALAGGVLAEPRLSLRGGAGGGGDGAGPGGTPWAWRVAAGEYRQYVAQLDVATLGPSALVPSVRFWLPAGGPVPVPRARHLAAEVVATPRGGWTLRAEGYAKRLPVLPAFDYAALVSPADKLVPNASPPAAAPGGLGFVAPARGTAYGAGARVAHAGPAARVEAGYDWGVSRRTFPSRFGGAMQPAPWNEPHRALLAVDLTPGAAGWRLGGWRLPAGLAASARARGVWGRTWGLRQVYYDLLTVHGAGAGLPVGRPGDLRRPPLYELDLGVSWTRALARGGRLEVGASVLNALDRRNVLDYALAPAPGGAFALVPRPALGAQPGLVVRVGR